MHSESKLSAPLAQQNSPQKEIAVFKQRVRRICNYCLCQEDAWQLHTCYGRSNRLQGVAIANKHAGFQGMPRVTQVEAAEITKAILDRFGRTEGLPGYTTNELRSAGYHIQPCAGV